MKFVVVTLEEFGFTSRRRQRGLYPYPSGLEFAGTSGTVGAKGPRFTVRLVDVSLIDCFVFSTMWRGWRGSDGERLSGSCVLRKRTSGKGEVRRESVTS